jgi:hypothetical protein
MKRDGLDRIMVGMVMLGDQATYADGEQEDEQGFHG